MKHTKMLWSTLGKSDKEKNRETVKVYIGSSVLDLKSIPFYYLLNIWLHATHCEAQSPHKWNGFNIIYFKKL